MPAQGCSCYGHFLTLSSTAPLPSGSDNLLRGILDAAMDAIVVMDDDQRVVLFNGAAETMFGRTRQETIGSPVTHFMPERFQDGHLAMVRGFGDGPALARRMGAGRVVRAVRSNGEEFPVEASISVMVAEGRRIYTVIMRDVTERERERAALVRSNMDLQQFAFVASHDLRSPLRSIKGYLSLLGARWGERLDASARELIQRASAAVDQLDDLTEDLLSYASLDTETVRSVQVDCNLALADALRLLEAKRAESAAQVTADPLPVLRGERPQIVQLFQNLLANAMTYCKGRTPRVHIAARREQDGWLFSVADNGIGVEPRYRQRIFEIFKRLHASDEYPGTGMGLAICQRVVERHGGRIWVEDAPGGEGSIFFFTLADTGVPP